MPDPKGYIKSAQSSLEGETRFDGIDDLPILRDAELTGLPCKIKAWIGQYGLEAYAIEMEDGRRFAVSPEQLGHTMELLEG